MQPKLKEDPREWRKFVWVMACLWCALGYLAYRRHHLSGMGLGISLTPGAALLLLGGVRPRWFRGFYRVGMTASFHLGQFMGRVILVLFFLVALTPLGLLLRLMGKDLLRLKKDSAATTYWQPAKSSREFKRLF